MIDLASQFVENDGWIVCTQGSFNVDENFYLDLNKTDKEYLAIGQGDGFALRHHKDSSLNPIYIKVQNGLANRLRCISSFAKFAEQNNRPLFVNWSIGSGFSDEKFEDLFESWPGFIELISDDKYDDATKECLRLHEIIFKNEKSPERYQSKIDMDILFEELQDVFCYEGDSCLEYMFPKNVDGNYNQTKFLQRLVPKRQIQEKIFELTKKFDKNTIGVHIRKGDAVLSPWRRYYKVSTLDSFKKLMKNAISKNPFIEFFLSTDCEDTELKIRNEFPGRIVSQKKPFSYINDVNLNKPFQTEALIDLVCLSNTAEIIGSYWSSFSSCAADLGSVPLKIARHSYEKNVSVVVACRNREDALKVSLQSWLKFDEIAEIIIVDWSSDKSIKFLEKIDGRIRVVEVSDKQEFNLPFAYNLAARYATKEFLLKMDADYVLNPYYSLFENYDLLPGEFLTGRYKDDHVDNSLGFISFLNGMILIRTSDFWSVGGYSEDLFGYGYDDCDFYNKLEQEGMIRRLMNHSNLCVFHMPHSDFERSKNYLNKNITDSLKANVNRSANRAKKPIAISCPNLKSTYDKKSNFLKLVGNNTGNLVHQHAVCDLIKDQKLFVPDLDYNYAKINKECRVLVVPSSSFLSNHFSNDFMNFIEKIEIPIIFVGIGIGSNSYDPPTTISDASLRLIDLLNKRRLPIGVRGSITKLFLENYGVSNIFEVGCPSNFINKDPSFCTNLAQKFQIDSENIIFNQDNIWSNDFKKTKVEKMLFKNFMELNGMLVQQSYFIDCLRNNQKSCIDSVRLTLVPNMHPDQFQKLVSQFRVYVSIDQWMEDAARMDLSTGLRMHGNMIAHQAGCPAIWIYHDARTKELAEIMELPRISLEAASTCSTVQEIKLKANVDFNNYAKKRISLWKNMRELFDQFGITI
jgi:glycosyltransferase involved in cell wall biosynthesis